MKTLQLTQGVVTMVDDDDFKFFSQWKWHARSDNNGGFYAVRMQRNKKTGNQGAIRLHREVIGAKNGEYVDHKNGCKLDNRKENLRICTKSQNAMNQKKHKDNTSGYKGVSWNKSKNKWHAQIQLKGKRTHIGYYLTSEEGARAYDLESIKLFVDFANLNFPLK